MVNKHSIDDIIDKLYNKKLITNINKYKTPKPINYHDLCHKMSSILNSSNNGPNRVYVINCKQYHSFQEIITTSNDDGDHDDHDDDYMYESDESDGFTGSR